MAYASIDDVNRLLPTDEPVPDDYIVQVETVLEEATDLVIGYLDREWPYEDPTDEDDDGVPDAVPDAVRRVVARVALRAFEDEPDNPGATQTTNLMGPFSHTVNWSKESTDRSVYLSSGEKTRLDRHKAGGFSGGVGHFPMTGASGYAF